MWGRQSCLQARFSARQSRLAAKIGQCHLLFGKCCGTLWGGPPGLSGWACGPRIVMKTMWGGRPRLRRVSTRPACSPTGCAGFFECARVLQDPLFAQRNRRAWTPAAGLEARPTINAGVGHGKSKWHWPRLAAPPRWHILNGPWVRGSLRKSCGGTGRSRQTCAIPSETPSQRVPCKSQIRPQAPQCRQCAPTMPRPSRFPGVAIPRRSAAVRAPRRGARVAASPAARTIRTGRASGTGWLRRSVARSAP